MRFDEGNEVLQKVKSLFYGVDNSIIRAGQSAEGLSSTGEGGQLYSVHKNICTFDFPKTSIEKNR